MAEGCREVRPSMDRSTGAPRSRRRGAAGAKVASAATPRGSASLHAVSAERPPQNTRFLPALPTRKLSPCGNGHSLLHPQPRNKTQTPQPKSTTRLAQKDPPSYTKLHPNNSAKRSAQEYARSGVICSRSTQQRPTGGATRERERETHAHTRTDKRETGRKGGGRIAAGQTVASV